MKLNQFPQKQGLYDPQFEHDACGVGFIVHMKGAQAHSIVEQGLTILQPGPPGRGWCGS
jgi:glutamate synthase (ferredoxin)